MNSPDHLLERLEKINPVPDPKELRTDQVAPAHIRAGKQLAAARLRSLPARIQGGRRRRAVFVATTTAAIVIGLVAVVALFVADGPDNAGGSRSLQLTFDGSKCTYEGPRVISVGEVEIMWENQSQGEMWASVLKLDEDKTIQDLLDFASDLSNTDKPAWTQHVTPFWRSVPLGGTTEPKTVSVRPGLHALVCGTWTPYAGYVGSALTVVP